MCSVFNKIDVLVVLLKNEIPDILCLAETWLDAEKIKFFKIEGYKTITEYSRSFKWRRVLICVKNSVKSHFRPVKMDKEYLMQEEGVFEYCAAVWNCRELNKQIIILNMYRPPQESNFIRFFKFI